MPKYFAYYRWPLLCVATACSLSLWLFILLGQSKSFAEWNWVDILGEGGATVFIGIWIFFIIKKPSFGPCNQLYLLWTVFYFFPHVDGQLR